MGWEMVDEGWGRKAVDFATLAEPNNAREYVTVHRQLGLQPGQRLLDMACGSGYALELGVLWGVEIAGIDASHRLIEVARHRLPDADLHVGDMANTHWDDASFDVVTSFRGIWGTTPDAASEALRLLKPGGTLAMTVWGNVGKSPGAWMFAPFTWATEEKVQHQADMVSLGRPGVGEAFLEAAGFDVAPRHEVTFVMEASDPEHYARSIASTGPSYESIQSIGEDEFHRRAVELATSQHRDGVPLRGEIQVFAYYGTKPS